MNLGNELYFLHPFVSNSMLSRYSGKYKPEFIKAYAIGTLLDAMLTTSELVDFIRLRVLGYDHQFTQEDFQLCRHLRNICREHPEISNLLRLCIGQEEFYNRGVKFVWDGFEFELDCRIKYDLWSYELGWGCDIKTTTATTMQGFLKQAEALDYDQQRAFYMLNANAPRDILIGVCKIFPYPIFIHRIQKGDAFYNSGIHKVNACAYKLAADRQNKCA